jgi:hypothetical protein
LISVYPTLWKNGLPLNITNPNKEKLTAYFFNSSGQQLGNATTINSSLPTNVLANQKGIVYFRLVGAEGQLLGNGHLVAN